MNRRIDINNHSAFAELLAVELTSEEFRATKKKLWAIEDDHSNSSRVRKAARTTIALLNGKYKDRNAAQLS